MTGDMSATSANSSTVEWGDDLMLCRITSRVVRFFVWLSMVNSLSSVGARALPSGRASMVLRGSPSGLLCPQNEQNSTGRPHGIIAIGLFPVNLGYFYQ